jgi:hypothetical protein
VAIEDQIPGLTDKELDNLRANAERLVQSGTPAQKAEAARLLPIIEASAVTRRATNAVTAAEKKVARQQTLADARAKKARKKAADAAEAAEAAKPADADAD